MRASANHNTGTVLSLKLISLPRDATQSAVMPQYVVRPSARLSVCR